VFSKEKGSVGKQPICPENPRNEEKPTCQIREGLLNALSLGGSTPIGEGEGTYMILCPPGKRRSFADNATFYKPASEKRTKKTGSCPKNGERR